MQALIHTARSRGYTPRILEATEAVNQDQRQLFFELISNYYQGDLNGRVFAIWGLSFKPQTDDIREAPALTIIEKLQEAGARLQAHDPEAMTATQKYLGNNQGLSFAKTSYEAVEGADALIICTEWTKFREPDFERMRSLMKSPVIFDGRNLYNPEKVEKLGFTYFYIGQKLS